MSPSHNIPYRSRDNWTLNFNGDMTEGSMKGLENEEFVEVMHDYSYQREDRTIQMTEGEIFMLIKRASSDWWQVIRPGDQRPFYAPKRYLKVITVSYEQMKQVSRQGRQQQKSKQLAEEELAGHSHGMPHHSKDSCSSPPFMEVPSFTTPSASQSYMTKIEPSRVTKERNDPYPGRPSGLSSFKSESPIVPPKGLQFRSGSNDLPSPTAYSRGFSQSGHDSSSSHTSKSSLNDSSRCSMESLTQLHARKQAIKAASHDELMSGERSRSVLDVSQPKAASAEELDARFSGRDYLFRSNQLSYRHRSNSVDFRLFPKDLAFSEMKQGSLDKSRKPRLSKDPGNRRRSWAVEEVRVPEHFRPFKRAETQDAAIILDVPPKLPPKQRKHKHDPFGSSSENLGRLEGPIDIKLQEVKQSRPALPLTGPNVKRLSHDYDKSTFKGADSVAISESQRKASLRRQEGLDLKDPPVALPRKLIPPQVPSGDGKLEENPKKQGSKAGPTKPTMNESPKENIDSKVKSDVSDISHTIGQEVRSQSPYSTQSRGDSSSFTESVQRFGRVESFRKTREVTKSPSKLTGTPELSRKLYPAGTPESIRKSRSLPNTTEREIPPSSGHFKNDTKPVSKVEFGKDEEKENDVMRIPPREVHTPDSTKGVKLAVPVPSSPRSSPIRIVFDDWGEYHDDVTKRPFYFNARTHEKRWKPPRKGIHSVAIPEVPPHARHDLRGGSLGRGQTRSPPVDYHTSPKSPRKPFPNATLPVTGIGGYTSSYNQSSTLGSSSNFSAFHNPLTASQTLPLFPQSSRTISSPHNIPPLVPPSSAKPHLPTTPTTPTSPEFPEDQHSALLDTLYNLTPPRGWSKKYDSYTQRVYFHNQVTGERWLATNDEAGKIYYYEESGTKSQWRLPELDVCDTLDEKDGHQTSTLESQRVSLVTEKLEELSKNIVKEGFLHRTFLMKEGKKVRKNWTNSYARYIVSSFNSGSSGLIHFSKSKDDDKKAEIFDFIPTCSLDLSNDKKTSRQQVLGLRNGNGTEVLLQFEDKDIASEWYRVLSEHAGIQQNVSSTNEKEEKKGKKASEKMKRAASVEQLTPDSKGITDKLLNFIKRRPLKETLEKKGIYKEAVFGSTLAELHLQDKTHTPIFVLQCIKQIENSIENLSADGLYRISGNAAQIQKIRYEVAQRNYAILSKEKEVHNLSGALKLFFRELKEPLIPFGNYQEFIQATGSEYRKKNEQVEKLTKAVRNLPMENYETMKVLLAHLLRVSKYESENRMSVSNLAIVFGPCLLWPKITNAHDLMTDVMLHNRVIEGLLLDYDKIFSSRK